MTYDNDIVSASRDFVRRKQQQRNDLLEKRYAVATRDFQQIVEMIINDFNPLRIYQWGSLLNKKHFSEISDIDIAIEGLVDPQKFFNLFSKAMDMTDLPLDIVQLEFIHELQKKTILENGKLIYERNQP
jgi:predicted nucleotidyltransferase